MTDDRGTLGARPRSTTAASRAVRARPDRRAAGSTSSKGRLLPLPVEQFAESLLKEERLTAGASPTRLEPQRVEVDDRWLTTDAPHPRGDR